MSNTIRGIAKAVKFFNIRVPGGPGESRRGA